MMFWPRLLLLPFLCAGLWVPSQARANDGAALQAFASSEAWRQLMHYEASGFSVGHARSYVDDDRFFLAPDGRHNPQSELFATQQAFYAPVDGNGDEHPRCRFVARYRWMAEQQLVDTTTAAPLACEAYTEWRSQIRADSLVLVYASAHLNSPSSMYGHTLFRIDPPADAASSTWLSWGVSFGANIPKDEAAIVYAYKGIAGGYPGLFNVQPFYEKIEQYSKMENRDLWEYRLNLTQEELDRLVEHLWELKDINFAYYFFDENCAYRLLELLEFARPAARLTTQFHGTTIPVDTVRVIRDAGFIATTDYRPSSETRLQARMKTLTRHERTLANDVMRGERAVNDPEVLALAPVTRYAVYDMAYRALRFRERKQARDPELAKRSLALLREINALSAYRSDSEPRRPAEPESGHDTALMAASAGVLSRDSDTHDDHRSFGDLELRLSFHDLLDPLQGYLPGAAINMGRFVLRKYEGDDAQLQVFDVVDINSMSASNRFYRPWSWRARVGFERLHTADDDYLAPQANTGFGYSLRLADDVMAYALLTGRAEYNPVFADNIQLGVGSAAGVLLYNSWGAASINWEQTEFLNGYDRNSAGLAQDISLMKNVSLRMTFTHYKAPDVSNNEAQVSLRYFY